MGGPREERVAMGTTWQRIEKRERREEKEEREDGPLKAKCATHGESSGSGDGRHPKPVSVPLVHRGRTVVHTVHTP